MRTRLSHRGVLLFSKSVRLIFRQFHRLQKMILPVYPFTETTTADEATAPAEVEDYSPHPLSYKPNDIAPEQAMYLFEFLSAQVIELDHNINMPTATEVNEGATEVNEGGTSEGEENIVGLKEGFLRAYDPANTKGDVQPKMQLMYDTVLAHFMAELSRVAKRVVPLDEVQQYFFHVTKGPEIRTCKPHKLSEFVKEAVSNLSTQVTTKYPQVRNMNAKQMKWQIRFWVFVHASIECLKRRMLAVGVRMQSNGEKFIGLGLENDDRLEKWILRNSAYAKVAKAIHTIFFISDSSFGEHRSCCCCLLSNLADVCLVSDKKSEVFGILLQYVAGSAYSDQNTMKGLNLLTSLTWGKRKEFDARVIREISAKLDAPQPPTNIPYLNAYEDLLCAHSAAYYCNNTVHDTKKRPKAAPTVPDDLATEVEKGVSELLEKFDWPGAPSAQKRRKFFLSTVENVVKRVASEME